MTRKMQRVGSRDDMAEHSIQEPEQVVEPGPEQPASDPSGTSQQPGRNIPGLSITPLVPGSGNGVTKASVSIASMMAVALLGTMTLGQNPQTIGSSPLGDDFDPRMNADASDIPNGRIKQESLGIGGAHFLKRKLYPTSSDSDEDENMSDGEPQDHDHDYDDPDDLERPLYDGQYLELAKVDAPVPALSNSYQVNANLSAQSLDALCDQMDFTSVKQYLKQFYKVQELRDDFLHRKLKELCEERLRFKNASDEVDAYQ